MELKQQTQQIYKFISERFNRTFMELKHRWDMIYIYSSKALIGPLWN